MEKESSGPRRVRRDREAVIYAVADELAALDAVCDGIAADILPIHSVATLTVNVGLRRGATQLA